MKNILFIFILLCYFYPSISQAQGFSWIDAEETGYEMNPSMVNYAVSAAPDGTAWFVGMKEKVLSYTDMMGDLFVIHYDQEGNRVEEYLINGALIVHAIENDDDGNLYIGGEFYNEDIEFWEGTVLTWEAGNVNGFLAKIQPGGIVEWVVNLNVESGSFTSVSALVYHSGMLYAALGGWPSSRISAVDGNGVLSVLIEQNDVAMASGLDLDSEGNLYVTGSCSGNQASFNGTNYVSPFSYSRYLVKYDPQGISEWIHFSEDVTCIFPNVQVDQEDYVYWSGLLHNASVFDTIPLLGPSWVFDFYLTRFNPEGEIQWAREVPQIVTGDASPAKVNHLIVMPDNSVTFIGLIRGTIDWGNGVVSSSPIPGNNALMINFNSEGMAQWTKTSMSDYYAIAQALDTDADGHLFITGIAHDTLVLDELQIYRESFYYPWIVKLETTTTAAPLTMALNEDIVLYPNPARESMKISCSPDQLARVQLISMSGQVVLEQSYRQTIHLNNIRPGLYFVNILLEDGRVEREKVMVIE